MRVWLDDERPKPYDFDVHVNDPESAIALLNEGYVTHLSLDHDLGLQPDSRSGYMVAVWIEEQAFYGLLKPLTWTVHSANPSGRARIVAAMQRADEYWSQRVDFKGF